MVSGFPSHLLQQIGDGVPGRINLIWAASCCWQVMGKVGWDEAGQYESSSNAKGLDRVDGWRRIVSPNQISLQSQSNGAGCTVTM